MQRIKSIAVIGLLLSTSLLTFLGVSWFNIADQNPLLVSSLPSSIITLYTAIVAILVTILAIHVPRQYGLSSIDILTRKSKGMLAFYSTAILFSLLSMILDSENFRALGFEVFSVSISVGSVLLTAEIIVISFSIYFISRYLLEILRISPMEIMRDLGFPNAVSKLVEKGRLFQVDGRLSKGLSLIRICIMDLSMRDDLEKLVLAFDNAINQIPWSEKREERSGSKRIDMTVLLLYLINRMEECIFDPLVETKLKPSQQSFSRLFSSFMQIFIKADLLNSSIFGNYLSGLYQVAENFVKVGKKEALDNLFLQKLWVFKEDMESVSYISLSSALSEGIALSASLIRQFEVKPNKIDDIRYILFVISTHIEHWLSEFPRILSRLPLENLIYLMESRGIQNLTSFIIPLFRIEKELERIKESENEFVYGRVVTRFRLLIERIKAIMKKDNLRVFVKDHNLDVLSIDDGTVARHQLENILNESDTKALETFVKRHLR